MGLRTLYLDTSVVGGYFDKEYQKETRLLWELWKSGRFRFVSSVVVEEEIEPAPEQVRRLYAETFPEENRLALSMAAIQLAVLYVRQGVVTPKYLSDARHVAVCALAGITHRSVGISGIWSMSNGRPDLTPSICCRGMLPSV